MPAKRKISSMQMELLVSYMEEHKALARGQSIDTPQAKAAFRQQWEELAATLNAVVMGAKKTGSQWRDYWRDVKYRAKKKVGELEVRKRGTEGGLLSTVVLTPLEERIAIIGSQAVLGDEEVRIPCKEEFDLPAPSSPPSLGVIVKEEVSSDAQEEFYLPAPSSPPSLGVIVKEEVSPDAPLMPPAPFPRPQSPASQPSSSRAPPVEGPSAANSPAFSKRKHRAEVTVEARTPSAGDSPAASKRSRRADDTAAANPTEVLLALEQRRLNVQQGMLAQMRRVANLLERSVVAQERSVVAQEGTATTLREVNENIATIIEHLDQHR